MAAATAYSYELVEFNQALLVSSSGAAVYSYESVEFNPGTLQSSPRAAVYSEELVVYDPANLVSVAGATAYSTELVTYSKPLNSARGVSYSYDNIATAGDPTTLKVWNGTTWVAQPRYTWDGTQWVQIS